MDIRERKFEVIRDGRTIRGIELLPEGNDLPIAIVSHGFLSNYDGVYNYAKQFAKWGFAAYCFDFIGGGIECRSDGKLSEMTVLTEVEDLLAVIAYASSLPYTDESDITLMGCSQGGFVSSLVAAKLKEKIKRIILFYPALCIPDDARRGNMMIFKFDPKNIPDELRFNELTLSGNYAHVMINMDPYKEIAPYKGKVLIVHGEKDGLVNVSYSYKAKETYGDSCTLIVIDGADHGFKGEDNELAISAVEDFIKNT